jgi:hypothetical protein
MRSPVHPVALFLFHRQLDGVHFSLFTPFRDDNFEGRETLAYLY